jgi:hypothetical protein
MQPILASHPATRFQWSSLDFSALRAFGLQDLGPSVDDGPYVELNLTTPLREELAGFRRAASFVRRVRRGRVNEFLEPRITPEWIEHRIEPDDANGGHDCSRFCLRYGDSNAAARHSRFTVRMSRQSRQGTVG